MKLLILDSWRLSTKISESGCWIFRHGERRWQELFFDGNKSYQNFPLKKSWVSPRVRTNQFHLLWWLSMVLVLRCCWSEWWFCLSVTPDVRTTKIWKQIAAHFSFLSCFLVSRGIPVWNDIMDRCFSTSWGLLCFVSKKLSCFLGTKFSCSLKVFCGVPLQMMKLVILDSWKLSTTVSEFGCWISGISESPSENCLLMGTSQPNLPSQGFLGAALRQDQPITTFFDGSQFFRTWLLLFLVMVLSMFNSSISCHHSWW